MDAELKTGGMARMPVGHDATQHPQSYYFARASNAPGAGLAHFVIETRGYLHCSEPQHSALLCSRTRCYEQV